MTRALLALLCAAVLTGAHRLPNRPPPPMQDWARRAVWVRYDDQPSWKDGSRPLKWAYVHPEWFCDDPACPQHARFVYKETK